MVQGLGSRKSDVHVPEVGALFPACAAWRVQGTIGALIITYTILGFLIITTVRITVKYIPPKPYSTYSGPHITCSL